MEEIRSMLHQPASQDRDSLRSRLTEMQEDTGAPNKQDIVAYVLKLVTTDPVNTEQTTLHVLPTIKQEHLHHLRHIGSGGCADVVEVEWLGQKVANKMFAGVNSRSFRVEANILAGLHHPSIVQIFGVSTGRGQSSSSIVMELMHGDLQRFLAHPFDSRTSTSYHREQSFTLLVALDIMLQIAEAMQYLHRKKITHRDLKSLNMLINTAQIPEIAEAGYVDVKVADFGTSKILTATTTISPQTLDVGTRLWMAPEVWFELEKDSSKMKYYPLKSDVYSYAITCYEILSGRLPFEGLRRRQVIETVREGLRPSLPNSLPTSLSSLIECCWDGDVRRRPSFSRICTELRHLKGIYLINDCGGANETFATLPFRMPPEDVDIEIETDNTVRDIHTLFRTVHDLERQVQQKEETLREQTEMLRERMETLWEQTEMLREKEETLREQTEMLREKEETLREQDRTIQMLLAREARFNGSNMRCPINLHSQ